MENLEEEIWKDVLGYEGFYQVSNFGNVKSLDGVVITKRGVIKYKKGITMSKTTKSNNYLSIMFSVEGKVKRFHIHRLVAIAFIPNPENKPEVNHKNGIKSDNRVVNLEWNTKKENISHSYENGFSKKGSDVNWSKLTDFQVLAVRRLFRINPNFNKLNVGKKLGVRDTTIHKIIKNQRWKHLQLENNPELSKKYQYSKVSGIKKSEL